MSVLHLHRRPRVRAANLVRRCCAIALAALAATVAAAAPVTDWADPAKVLRVAYPSDISGLDPAGTQETYASAIQNHIFDALYVWDYAARPYRFVPSIATGMPKISADGRVWTIHIRPGVYFTGDPAFNGRRRELVAADFVYAWKRVVDPRVRSPNADVLDHRLVGLDDLAAKAKATGRFDYDAPVEGLRALDRYTLQLTLVQPDYTFLELLDGSPLRAVAREVIEKYADASGRAMDHPVGTGPYRLKEWQQGRRIVLEANREYREAFFPPRSAGEPADDPTFEAMRGKRLPRIGRIDIVIVEETNPRLLMFDAGEVDYLDVPGDVAPRMIDASGRLRPEYAARGMRLARAVEGGVTFAYFNMEDPVVGGYTADKVALRRAVCGAYDVPDEIRVIRNGQALAADQPIPPDVEGHVENLKSLTPYDPATARALLDKFGYRDRDGDGYRELPDGRPLVIHHVSLTGAVYRQFDDLWLKSMREAGIRMDFEVQSFTEAIKAAHAGKVQFSGFGWSGDVPDNYLRQFYGPGAGAANIARFRSAEYDALYEKARRTPDRDERNRLYAAMTKIVAAQSPWCLGVYRISNTVLTSRVRGYRKNVHYFVEPWQYLDVEPARP